MTPEEEKALREEMARDNREYELELDLALERLDCAVDVLAWYLASSSATRQAPMWPDNSVVMLHEPLLVWLIFRDPIFFDQAKREVIETMKSVGVDESDLEYIGLTERLFFSERPAVRRKGGDHVGRDLLIIVAAQLGADWSDWDHNSSKADRPYSSTSIAKHLCDRLNEHPFLADFPDAVPTEDTVRSVWSDRHRKLKLMGVPDDLLLETYIFSVSV